MVFKKLDDVNKISNIKTILFYFILLLTIIERINISMIKQNKTNHNLAFTALKPNIFEIPLPNYGSAL